MNCLCASFTNVLQRVCRRQCAYHGSALLIMLWAVALLSATTLGLALYIDVGLDENASRSKLERARQLAESGLAVALHPLVERGDPLLQQSFGPVESFSVTMTSEGARINLNAELKDESSRVLNDLFNSWGLTIEEAEMVVDSLRDWIDADDLTRLDGMEYQGYAALGLPQFPRNKEFSSLDEAGFCRGMNLVSKVRPDWQNMFTLWSDGKINVNDADVETLVYAVGFSEAQAESLVEARLGMDGLPHTEDDMVFENTAQVRIFLGLPESTFAALSDKLTASEGITRIHSTGRVADLSTSLTALARRGSSESGGASEVLAIIEE